MGIGNLTNVLRAYAPGSDLAVPELVEEEDLSWARVFFDTAPDRNGEAHALLARLGDDSPTYYWRVLAAQEIMRLYREDASGCRSSTSCTRRRAAPRKRCTRPSRPSASRMRPISSGRGTRTSLQPLPDDPVSFGFAIDRDDG